MLKLSYRLLSLLLALVLLPGHSGAAAPANRGGLAFFLWEMGRPPMGTMNGLLFLPHRHSQQTAAYEDAAEQTPSWACAVSTAGYIM